MDAGLREAAARSVRRVVTTMIVAGILAGPAAARAADGLDALVIEGLHANRGIRGERLALRRQQAAVTEAVGLYLPSVALTSRISDFAGEIPDVGRFVNPAYGALNQLLGRAAFPTNVSYPLLQRQETLLRVSQPVLAPQAIAAIRVRAGQRDAGRATLATAERELAAAIRTAYLDCARTTRLVELYDSTRTLVDETVRVQEALLANGRATPDQVLRARADRSDIEQRRLDAGRLADAARRSLNLLLGRALDAPFTLLPDSTVAFALTMPLDVAVAHARTSRGELASARALVRTARAQEALAGAGYLPTVAASLDWGMQGSEYRLGSGQDYRAASLALQWQLFNGGQREAQRREAKADAERAKLGLAEASERVDMDVRTSWEAAAVARDGLTSARDRLVGARRAWELVTRRHAGGGASLLELLDARTTYTDAAINDILSTYDYWQRCVDLERAAGNEPPRPADDERSAR